MNRLIPLALTFGFIGSAVASPDAPNVADLAIAPQTTLSVSSSGQTLCTITGALYDEASKKGVPNAAIQLVATPSRKGVAARATTNTDGVYRATIVMPADADNVVLRERYVERSLGSAIPIRVETAYAVCGNATVDVGDITSG